ncbi:RNHCP domain-containing protein [Seinonella peptonophila]|nr:RNHCP domain-containing protein [Seinonella peptonophila]
MKKKRDLENTGFTCANCGREVLPLLNGSYRNHCPYCFYSLHIDLETPGDRRATCQGLMKPIDWVYQSKKGYQIVFECTRCGKQIRNRAALDDPRQPDDLVKLAQITNR